MYNRCTGIYNFGNNTYPRSIRRRSHLGHIYRGKKVRLMDREIQYLRIQGGKENHILWEEQYSCNTEL